MLHSRPRQGVRVEIDESGEWRITVGGRATGLGLQAVWAYYQQLLSDMGNRRPTELRRKASKLLRLGGESVRLQVVTRYRTENRRASSRLESWGTALLLWRTFGDSGRPGVGIRQRQYSEYRRWGEKSVLEGGTHSDCSYWSMSRRRLQGARIKSAPDAWAAELEAQFSPRIPIKALTPDEWCQVVEQEFTRDDIMSEQR